MKGDVALTLLGLAVVLSLVGLVIFLTTSSQEPLQKRCERKGGAFVTINNKPSCLQWVKPS